MKKNPAEMNVLSPLVMRSKNGFYRDGSTLYEGLSRRPSVGPSVQPSVGPSIKTSVPLSVRPSHALFSPCYATLCIAYTALFKALLMNR